MCNPNSSVASRRYLTAGPNLQMLVGSLMAATPTGDAERKIEKTNLTSELYSSDAPFDVSFCEQFRSSSQSNGNSMGFNSYSLSSSTQPSRYFNRSVESGCQGSQAEVSTSFGAAMRKPEAKRRRKPQKPGLTAKNQVRHFVQHHYHDYANDTHEDESCELYRRRGGVSVNFPLKLHSVLDQVENDGFANIISWQAHGRCFVIHDPKTFVEVVMPRYFCQTKLTSFQRQLNLYGFNRLTRGPDSGGYYHELFLRGKSYLCKRMVRTKVKGTRFKAVSSPDQEPNFYKMAPVVVSPYNSDCDHSEDGSAGRKSYSENPIIPPSADEKDFQPPVSQHVRQYSQQQNSSVSPMVNKLAMQIFGDAPPMELPSSPRLRAQCSTANPFDTNSSPSFVPSSIMPSAPSIPSAPSSEILDQSLNELFLEDSQAVNELMDFVSSWDSFFENGMGMITNDLELGNFLDKILKD